jgi:hypothetical protein
VPRVQLNNGLFRTMEKPTSVPTDQRRYRQRRRRASFIQGGSAEGRWRTKWYPRSLREWNCSGGFPKRRPPAWLPSPFQSRGWFHSRAQTSGGRPCSYRLDSQFPCERGTKKRRRECPGSEYEPYVLKSIRNQWDWFGSLYRTNLGGGVGAGCLGQTGSPRGAGAGPTRRGACPIEPPAATTRGFLCRFATT